MGLDIFVRFCPVQVPEDDVHVNALPDRGISLQAELLVPEFGLADKDQGHGAHGVKTVVQEEPEFLQCLFFQQMGLVKDTDDFFIPPAPEDLHFLLEPALCVSAVKL